MDIDTATGKDIDTTTLCGIYSIESLSLLA